MIENKLYVCSICGVEFKDKDECKKHEQEHSLCICKKQNYKKYVDMCLGYGRILVCGIDFKESRIYTVYSPHCDQDNYYSIPIKYCPLCGEKLIKERKDGNDD